MLVTLLGFVSACRFDPAGFPGGGGDGGTSPPDATPLPDADPCAAEEIAANASHTCARRADGLVWCWGDNGLGQIAAAATATSTAGTPCNPVPAVSSPLPGIGSLGLGDMHACAITPGSAVWCWGSNLRGQFGDGTSGFFTSAPTEIAARNGAVQIVGGETHACHLNTLGQVFCSGGNDSGELGVGSRTSRTIPARVIKLEPVTSIASGYRHMCAVRASDERVFCWGANGNGQVSWGTGGDVLVPEQIDGVTGVKQVTAGLSHTCALSTSGGVSCWGSNAIGQLGDGTFEFRSEPVSPSLEAPIDAIAAGGNRTCAIRQGDVFCWGESLDPSGGPAPLPVAIVLPGTTTAIASGAYHNCALLADRTVWCWGWDAYGQRGDGVVSGSIDNTPVRAQLCP